MAPGFSAIEDARFAQAVRFVDGEMLRRPRAAARYALDKGILELTGSDAANRRPHVVNEQITVDAARIDVTLEGPHRQGGRSGEERHRAAERTTGGREADALDAEAGSAGQRHRRRARLRRERSRAPSTPAPRSSGRATRRSRGPRLSIDSKTGDLNADGPVTTTTVMLAGEQGRQEGARPVDCDGEGVQIRGCSRRATYTGDAHMSGPQGDMTAAKIELYLKAVGRRARARRGVRERHAARAEPQDDRHAPDLLRPPTSATSSPARR